MILMRFLLTIIVSLAVSSCGAFKADKDLITGKKIRKEADLMKRGEDYAKEQGGIFNSGKLNKVEQLTTLQHQILFGEQHLSR